MKVLIVSTNRCLNPMPVMPFGACIVADAARAAGHDTRFVDFAFLRNPVKSLERELASFKPDVVGVSVRNIDNNDMDAPVEFYQDLPRVVGAARRIAGAHVVLGGAAVGVMPEALLVASGAPWAVPGRGETVFPRLLAAFERGEDPRTVPGVAWLDNGALRQSGGSCADGPSDCGAADFGRWLDLKKYVSSMCTAGIQTKRGCPHKCVYCTYAITEGQQYVLADPASVVPVARRLVSMGIRDAEFVDSVFNSPYDHAMAVCENLARADLGLHLHTVELNPAFVDDGLLVAMERAGFTSAGITAESASDPVLAGLGKGYTAEHVHKAARAARKSSMPFVWFFLMGGPGETKQTIIDTLRFAREEIRPDDIVFFNLGVRIYPGTELEAIARRQGVLNVPRERMLEPVFYFSPEVSRRWAVSEVRATTTKRMNFIGGASINFPWLSAIQRFAYRLGVRPPIWRHTRLVRRMLKTVGMDPI